jgi:hypothetical protein
MDEISTKLARLPAQLCGLDTMICMFMFEESDNETICCTVPLIPTIKIISLLIVQILL